MASRRIRAEWIARMVVLVLVFGLSAMALTSRWINRSQGIDVHARMPEAGGWSPTILDVDVGEPLNLRLISDDVVHGFAVGQSSQPPVDVLPGKVSEVSLTFDEPGTYTFYCTRWCGPNHWRMRGTIEVNGTLDIPETSDPPLYLTLGIDLDSPHEVPVDLVRRPSVKGGAALDFDIPEDFLTHDYYLSHSPYEAWRVLRDESSTSQFTDDDIWDLVAWLWASNTTTETLHSGEQIYEQNCAACHGQTGKGDGIFATNTEEGLPVDLSSTDFGHKIVSPTDFTDPIHMLGAAPARLHGKILRGGMGTGMPSWGLILTDDQVWAVVSYLSIFQFEPEVKP
jgi:cytochrome c oxidase subunit 2